MELTAHYVAKLYGGGQLLAVFGGCYYAVVAVGGEIGMYEVNTFVFFYIAHKATVTCKVQSVPADVRDLETLGEKSLHWNDASAEQSKSLVLAVFVAFLKQKLHTEANTHYLLAAGDLFLYNGIQTAFLQQSRRVGKRANAGKLDGVNVLLRPVSAESLDNLVATSTAPFITHETARAAQSLNSPAPGGFLIVSDEGSDFVDQPWPSASLYDYPPQEQWNAFQKLAQMLMHTPFNAEGIVTKIFTDANGTQHIGLHPIPDRSGLWRYLSTTLLLLTMLGSAIYNGVQAWRRYQRHRTRMMEIQAYYESCLNPQLITPSESLIE